MYMYTKADVNGRWGKEKIRTPQMSACLSGNFINNNNNKMAGLFLAVLRQTAND